MAEEPQPTNIQEGADPPDALPANEEDRKAAKAMSSLEARGGDEDKAEPKKEVDLKALNEAMNNLGFLGKEGEQQKTQTAVKKKEEPKKPLVKVDQADVALLVSRVFGLREVGMRLI